MSVPAPHRGKKKATANPIATAAQQWLSSISSESSTDADAEAEATKTLLEHAPKRWTTYSPMVLLPSGSFTSLAWKEKLEGVTGAQRTSLWAGVLGQISKKSGEVFTHLAANEGIPLQVTRSDAPNLELDSVSQAEKENIMRSPSGLKMLHGDFGPAEVTHRSMEATEPDFDKALWVTTKQNGIHQTWAPRWTMFSRGNVKEKARLLNFHDEPGINNAEGNSGPRILSKIALKDKWAVDLYAGIGYFVFSYARLGFRVLCWEINPWSVEGLRRGALRNGWSVKVVKGGDRGRPMSELMAGEETIVVFQESNEEARARIRELRNSGTTFDVRHVNCGLLPRSDGSWKTAWYAIGRSNDGWLHLHENVGVRDIEDRRKKLQAIFDDWSTEDGEDHTANVEHVELVKTFAPDVWHCVFDVYIKCSKNDDT